MSKKYNVIPSNRKTLFLRNLEMILTNHEIMCECKTKEFRRDTSLFILDLIKEYVSDVEKDTNFLMTLRYGNDSLFIRFLNDRSNLSVNHSHN
jgi:hypothetical protein